MRVLSIVGARPQFIKAAPVSRALAAAGNEEILVHTGQHYDRELSDIFFEELGLPPPAVNLGVGSGPHGWQTARMLDGLERVIDERRPDVVIVYGDTNSTLAGALAAAKLRVRLAHVEAGLRSFNRSMPEETNRVLADHCADLLFCPSTNAVENLRREGITAGVHNVGDTMLDALLLFRPIAEKRSRVLERLALRPGGYLLATVHRAGTVDDPMRLRDIVDAFVSLDGPVVLPIHPRTRARLEEFKLLQVLEKSSAVRLIPPVGFLDMLMLERNARAILTDSGGIQKEAFYLEVPCLTLRNETEWVETVESGWNVLAGGEDLRQMLRRTMKPSLPPPSVYGDGTAASRIVACLAEWSGNGDAHNNKGNLLETR